MVRIGICDDEINARDTLRFALEKIIDDQGDAEIVYEFSCGEIALSWFSKHPGEIDLLFLDIDMNQLNGMDTAKKIREFNKDLMIVFVTGYSDYVFDGYAVNALDYIMKPIKMEKLQALMERVFGLVSCRENDYMVINNTEGSYRLPLSDIMYFYSNKRKVIAVTALREYDFYDSLSNQEKLLGNRYIRIHQRYLVNPTFVSHIGSASVTIKGEQLPLSRGYKDSATTALAKSIIGRI